MRLFSLSLSVACLFATAASAEQVWVSMDQVKPYTFKQEVDQIVIGNPGIADITVRDKSRVLLFGKSPGLTNMFLFDADGNEIENLIVRVRATNSDLLTLQRGGQRYTYNCTSVCEQTLIIGDSQEAFGAVSTQVQQKYQQAAGASAPSE
ncbi:MAG: pilus assembly protein N-terminal domain-containing protein [Parvularculaceae bacterium]|mgnify:CR=1 FL=1|nr:pilus assembly protein N-terminal domain-containing protein [Parvularculaceae bacterium]